MIIQTDKLNRILSVILYVCLAIGVSLHVSSCTPDMSDDPIPYQPFDDVVINLNLPEYVSLATDHGYKNISEGGIRGLLIYRENSSTYIAFEKNCSYHPNDACATVDVHASTLYMIDPCCGSSFSFPDGEPYGGPAWRPLRRYETYLNGNELIISDEIVQ